MQGKEVEGATRHRWEKNNTDIIRTVTTASKQHKTDDSCLRSGQRCPEKNILTEEEENPSQVRNIKPVEHLRLTSKCR